MAKSIADIQGRLNSSVWGNGIVTYYDLNQLRAYIASTRQRDGGGYYTGAYDINGIYDYSFTYVGDCACVCSK